jgi:hypothetical protein
VHVLFTLELPSLGSGGERDVKMAAKSKGYVHSDVIQLLHCIDYDEQSDAKSVHVQQTGKKHPKPALLRDVVDSETFDATFAQLVAIGQTSLTALWVKIGALWSSTRPSPMNDEGEGGKPGGVGACHASPFFYQLFGFDILQDASGRCFLLECNSYPAIASGTMQATDPRVYTTLMGDLLKLVVSPICDGSRPVLGGFVQCADLN